MLGFTLACASLIAIDGDTLRCDGRRLRLIGIDAPELPGHCRRGRKCVAGDPRRSTAALAAALTGKVRIEQFGVDRYGRALVAVRVNGADLSCAQLLGRHAVYVPKWDHRQTVAQRCPDALGLR